ncbi:hypothetical protein L665_04473 [Ralstonia solanacearum SD54]|nr:hypothetical protein F504_3653 [Ralstonia pseudosolanacearum FQY_4]ESS50253.1 hypothetical protein L665_04473 [Ralstonia solanacearum SD54]
MRLRAAGPLRVGAGRRCHRIRRCPDRTFRDVSAKHGALPMFVRGNPIRPRSASVDSASAERSDGVREPSPGPRGRRAASAQPCAAAPSPAARAGRCQNPGSGTAAGCEISASAANRKRRAPRHHDTRPAQADGAAPSLSPPR